MPRPKPPQTCSTPTSSPSTKSASAMGGIVSRRGLAHLAAHRPAEAAAEFRKILDHRGIVLADPLDAMARLRLACALATSGETVKAKSTYEDFLDLWNGADPDIPVLAQAKSEYARQGPVSAVTERFPIPYTIGQSCRWR
jgi:hypothetical protein